MVEVAGVVEASLDPWDSLLVAGVVEALEFRVVVEVAVVVPARVAQAALFVTSARNALEPLACWSSGWTTPTPPLAQPRSPAG